MSDGRSKRKAKVIRFIDKVDKDRTVNFIHLVQKSKMYELEGFEKINWRESTWTITAGRLLIHSGKNSTKVDLNFLYSPSLGGTPISDNWDILIKALVVLRFHRRQQSVTNQRNFITAAGYVAYVAENRKTPFSKLVPEILDEACKLISLHYEESTMYRLHGFVAEFAAHCDSNGLCRSALTYKYGGLKRLYETGGVGHKRLDDPETLETKSDKLIDPYIYQVIGSLYSNVPKAHKYRFYVLILVLFVCTGRRFSEISLLPYQKLKYDREGLAYIEYFPRKKSDGDTYTPSDKLYLISETIPILKPVLEELEELCDGPRKTATYMQENGNADLSFLDHLSEKQRIYKKDLEYLGISPTVLNQPGWIRMKGYSYKDNKKLTMQGKRPANPIQYTTKEGLVAYCEKDYHDVMIKHIHIDQFGKKFFLKDLMLVRHRGSSSGNYTHWLATQCTHSMMTTFMRYFEGLVREFTSSDIQANFTTHHFRHTLSTLLDEGGLTDLFQT